MEIYNARTIPRSGVQGVSPVGGWEMKAARTIVEEFVCERKGGKKLKVRRGACVWIASPQPKSVA